MLRFQYIRFRYLIFVEGYENTPKISEFVFYAFLCRANMSPPQLNLVNDSSVVGDALFFPPVSTVRYAGAALVEGST